MNYYNPLYNINKFDDQIRQLQDLKNQYQQAPIQNFINSNIPVEMEAKYLKPNEKVEDIIIMNKTLFIDETNSKIYVKEKDGTISKTYDIIIPKTEEQLKIEELSNKNEILSQKLEEMEKKLNEQSNVKLNNSINEIKQSNAINVKSTKSTSKTNSK